MGARNSQKGAHILNVGAQKFLEIRGPNFYTLTTTTHVTIVKSYMFCARFLPGSTCSVHAPYMLCVCSVQALHALCMLCVCSVYAVHALRWYLRAVKHTLLALHCVQINAALHAFNSYSGRET